MSTSFPSRREAAWTLSVLLIAYILSFVDRQVLNLLIGPIRRDLGISDFQMSFLQGAAFALFYVTLGLPIARLADRLKRKVIIAVGILLWSLMTMTCGLATSFGMLFWSRVGVGVGEAALSPAAYSILSDSFPPSRLARATSIYTMGITLGGGVAYIVGGSVNDWLVAAGVVTLPILGSLQPWQLTFVTVGLPGILVALLVSSLREPHRQPHAFDPTSGSTPTLADVLTFLRTYWLTYRPIFLSVSLLSLLGYGYLNWYPAFLMRTYGLGTGDVGRYFGALYLAFGTLGAFCGALFSEALDRRGHRDAALRAIAWISAGLAVPATTGPLMPTAAAALAVAAPTIFLLSAYFGLSIVALQLVSPNRMRAVLSAVFLFSTTVTGLAFGTTLVAFLTQYVFRSDLALRYSLAVLAVVVCPLAAWVAARGLRDYRRAIEAVARSAAA